MKQSEEVLNGQVGNTLTTDSNEQLIEKEEVKGTPFHIVTAEGKSFIAMGRYRLSEENESKQALRDRIYDLDYNFIINLMFMVHDMIKKAEIAEKTN